MAWPGFLGDRLEAATVTFRTVRAAKRLAEHPGAGVEMDQSLIDEYDRAEAAWRAVQGKIGVLARKDWRERYGPARLAGGVRLDVDGKGDAR